MPDAIVYGVKETKELLDFGFAIPEAFKNANSDGHIDGADLGYLVPVFIAAGPALKDIALVAKEMGDLSPEEAADVLAYAGQKLPHITDSKQLVAKVNVGLKLGLAVAQAIVDWKAADKLPA